MLYRYDVPDLWAANGTPVQTLYHTKQIHPDVFLRMVEEATEIVVRQDPEGKKLAARMRKEGSRGGLTRRYAILAPFVLNVLCRQHGFRARASEGRRVARRSAVAA